LTVSPTKANSLLLEDPTGPTNTFPEVIPIAILFFPVQNKDKQNKKNKIKLK
jgi:hypothetical protein